MPNRIQVADAVTTPAGPHKVHFTASSISSALWWIALFTLHGVNVAYYVGAAVLYHAMRFTNVDFQLTIYSIGICPANYFTVSYIHWVVGGLHALLMALMVVGSVRARRFVYQPTMPTWMALRWRILSFFLLSTKKSTPDRRTSSLRNSLTRRVSSFTESSVAISSSVFGREGLLGVDSAYFDHVHLARELLETTLQTIQVYRMSYLLPRVWLIRFYVILLILNCWSTPLVHRIYHNRHTHRRMMSLLCDAVLDMVSSIGVSLWIFATYVPQYTDPTFGFPFENWFDDVWFTTMQQEFQMMLVASWADMASRLVFAAGLLQCMEAIKEMLTPVDTIPKDAPLGEKTQIVAVMPVADKQNPPKPRRQHSTWWRRVVKFSLEKAGPGFFVVLGFAILVVHIVSETRGSSADVPCQLVVHPWFVSKPACSLVELDCHQLGGLSGSQDSMTNAWNSFEFGATARIFVRHCPQLQVPQTIQLFKQATAVKLYNCTVVSWSEEAALTGAAHPHMRALFFVRTEFPNGELPTGLLTPQYPQGLSNVVTSATNLRSLPDNLHELWPPGMTLAFERVAFQEVPPTIVHMNALLLSFAGSPISTVPPQFFESPVLECVLLSYTLVQELPRMVENPSPAFYLMLLEGTNVSTFWSWMDPFVSYSLFFNSGFFNPHGSRYCAERDEIVAGNRSSFAITDTETHATDLATIMDVSTPAKLAFALSAVVCEPGFPYYFPLDLQDATTAL